MTEIIEKILRAGGRIYLVGGAVRDSVMGLIPHDRDYCVTGLTAEQFVQMFPDAEIAGKDFPVFRINGAEYALARTEKKNGIGYRGFEVFASPSVTIETDLGRRDLTINAMAIDMATGAIVDPFGGVKDIRDKTIRAASPAFDEDPLRVYRAARFAAKFGFTVEPGTIRLMASLRHELDALSAERVFEETRKALNTEHPSLFFKTLAQAGVLDIHFKEIAALISVPQLEKYHPEGDAFEHAMNVLDRARSLTDRAEVVFAALVHDLGKALTDKNNWPHHYGHDKLGVAAVHALGTRLKLPKAWIAAGTESATLHMKACYFEEMRPSKKVELLEAISRSVLGFDGLTIIVKADTNNDISYLAFLARDMFASVNGKTLANAFKKNSKENKAILRQARASWLIENGL
jgi:tRNA nucleotidyltransferase (CCA-adding enzyme)